MAWNRKSLSPQTSSIPAAPSVKAGVGIGAPVATMPGYTERGYRDSWDIQKAYREGMQKVTWVFRCIDAIAGNQARLPVVLRKGNSPEGEVVRRGDHPLLDILNTKANEGENSFVFRYRLSSQVLMSTRGVFIEVIRNRIGEVLALQLLPPDYTAPIPDARRFVSGFEVELPGMQKKVLSPDKVLWIRRPHPLNPYLSLTPMESAGMAIEIENLAKLYNRNFLLNDGRPGGLLVVKSEMDEDDKDELRSRFRGNLNRAGGTSVISSEQGVDYVDTGSNPRDAAYSDMRQVTKEEILTAFGVPESAIGNAAGRTFSNAAEELRVFWMETMLPHLEVLARGFDELDPTHYVDFYTDEVPIIIVVKQERERYLREEMNDGAISFNEYRVETGRKPVESELADSLLANPNLTPIGNTEKPFNPQQQVPVEQAGVVPEDPNALAAGAPPVDPNAPVDPTAPVADPFAPAPFPEEAVDLEGGPRFAVAGAKGEDGDDEWLVKAEQASERWADIVDRALERVFERQRDDVLAKVASPGMQRALATNSLQTRSLFDQATWDKALDEELRPLLAGIMGDGSSDLAEVEVKALPTLDEAKSLLTAQMKRLLRVNDTTRKGIEDAVVTVKAMPPEEDRLGTMQTAIKAVFADLLGRRRRNIAEHEAQTALNAGVFLAAVKSKVPGHKVWVSRHDERVRPAHKQLDADRVNFGEPFVVDGVKIRFPGDPLAPPHLTINCRCKLRFRPGRV